MSRTMQPEEAQAVRPGDDVRVVSRWHHTERVRKLAVPTKVLAVRHERCQTGVMLRVRDVRGQDLWLSAGWFEAPTSTIGR